MLKNLKNTLIIVVLLHFTTISFAQNTSFSPYSRYGIGELKDPGLNKSLALGGATQGLRSPYLINPENPASFSSIAMNTFIFEVGVKSKTGFLNSNESSQTVSFSNLDYLAIGFAANKWLGFSFGMMPMSSVGYQFMDVDETDETYTIGKQYIGIGGTNKFYFGTSVELHQKLSLGVSASYLFGYINHNKNISLLQAADGFLTQVVTDNNTEISDFNFDIGLQYSTQIGDYRMVLGASYVLGGDINSETNILITNSVQNSAGSFLDTLSFDEGISDMISLPQEYKFGISLVKSKKYLFALDYAFSNWSSLTNSLDNSVYSDNQKLSFGFEYHPNSNSNKFWEVVQYRIGAYYTKSYITINDTQLEDKGVSFGLGLPLRGSSTSINLSLRYGSLGSTDFGLIQENYLTVYASFSLNSIWFVQRKFD